MGNVLLCHQKDRRRGSIDGNSTGDDNGDSINNEKMNKIEFESDSFDDKPIPSMTVLTTESHSPNAHFPGQSELTAFATTGWAALIASHHMPQSDLFSSASRPSVARLSYVHTENPARHRWSDAETYTQHEKWEFTQSPNEILPTIFLGSKKDAGKDARLKELKITHILSVTSGKQHEVEGCKLMTVAMADNGNSDLFDVMARAYDFIEESQQKGNKILIHCHLGQNRSPTVVIAWLMAISDMHMHEAYMFVKEKRQLIHPHKLYIQQLRELDKLLHGVWSVKPDFLTLTVNNGEVKVSHENWSPKEAKAYRDSQDKEPRDYKSGSFSFKLKSDFGKVNQSSPLGVSHRKNDCVESDMDALPLSSISEQEVVLLPKSTPEETTKVKALVNLDGDQLINSQEVTKEEGDSTVSFQYSLARVPTPTRSSE